MQERRHVRASDDGRDTAAPPLVLPVPAVLDSGAAVLLHLLIDERPGRAVLLDAAGLREITPVGALLLAATLRGRSRGGEVPRILNLAYPLRLELSRHPLLAYAEVTGHAAPFAPSARPVSTAS